MGDQQRTSRTTNPGEGRESSRQGSESSRQGSEQTERTQRQGSERQGTERQGSSRQGGSGQDQSSSTSGTDRDFDESGEAMNQGHGHPREERGTNG